MTFWARTVGAAVALALVGGLVATPGSPATAQPPESRAPVASSARSSTVSSVPASVTKTDKVKTPKLRWFTCVGGLRCATAKVPRDYDKPKGAKTELSLIKRPANRAKGKIGTLFVNPGGPGGSATMMAAFADVIFGKKILDRFDVVGVDPRGIAFSDNVQCFSSLRTQTKALKGYAKVAFPVTGSEVKAWLKTSKTLGRTCSKRKGLATSMSTAEVARDMEMMRRAVGDKKLSYLGFSYGTYLGQVYANMYPKRFRAIVIDGVLDPRSWAGTTKSLRAQPVGTRVRSGEAGWKALREILVRCKQVGVRSCTFATGDPVAKFAALAQRLKRRPLVVRDGGDTVVYTYDRFIVSLLSSLYDPDGWDYAMSVIADTYALAFPSTTARSTVAATHRQVQRLGTTYAALDRLRRPGFGFPYDNDVEANNAVVCTDSRENTKLKKFATTYAKAADRKDPYFTRVWMFATSACAADAYTGNDEDAYRGPFTRRTKAPVLVVGNLWDPATNYAGAQAVARLLPNSRLLSNDSWGHTAYLSSSCAGNAVDRYLLSGKVARAYPRCVGDSQPFQSSDEEMVRSHQRARLMARLTGGLG